MKTQRKHQGKPWQPTIERASEFNAFVNPMDRTGELENPLPLGEIEEEPKGESTSSEQRRVMIAEAAYFIAERRGFSAGGEMDDWLLAEVEIDRLLMVAPAA